jgi:DNA polymerase-3 subunit delta
MKLNFQQLEQQLTNRLSALYLICGDDPILKQDAVQQIRKAAQKAGFSQRLRLQTESGLMDEEQLYTALFSSSLSTEKTLVELDCRSKAPVKSIATILENYIANPSPDILVLIDMSKLEDTTSRSAWYKAFEKAGSVVTIWPVPREQLPQWIMTRARKYKMTISPEAAALLTDYVEGNLTAAAQTIEKLYLLKPEQTVDVTLIQSVLADESRFTVFDLTEAMLGDSPTRTLHILETLRLDGTEPVIVLWGIARELRILADIAAQQQTGLSWDEAFKKHRIFPRRQTSIRRFLGRFNAQQCQSCLVHAAEIDTILKGGKAGNGWEALQMLCLRLV